MGVADVQAQAEASPSLYHRPARAELAPGSKRQKRTEAPQAAHIPCASPLHDPFPTHSVSPRLLTSTEAAQETQQQ